MVVTVLPLFLLTEVERSKLSKADLSQNSILKTSAGSLWSDRVDLDFQLQAIRIDHGLWKKVIEEKTVDLVLGRSGTGRDL